MSIKSKTPDGPAHPSHEETVQKNRVTYKDIVIQQSMVFASTDDLVAEIEKRLYRELTQITGFEKFETETIVEEIARRIEKFSMLYADVKESLMLGEAYMSLTPGFIPSESWESRVLSKSSGITGSAKT